MKPTIVTSFILFVCLFSFVDGRAQEANRKDIRKGNNAYRKGLYQESEKQYRKALRDDPSNAVALYNMGNALLRQRKVENSVKSYKTAVQNTKVPLYKAQMYHNLGVVYQSQKQYQQAIDMYENALRNNPQDNQSRYNLALCKHLLKKQGGGNNNSSSPKNLQNQNPQNKKSEQKGNQQKSSSNDNSSSMSKDNAERLLELSKMEEQDIQRRIQRNKYRAQPKSLDKNW